MRQIKENMEFDIDKKYCNLPTVVLAGRPNVGKSTLFNRLLRRRRAITDPTPGVTRDPVEMDGFIEGKPVKLIDTGGFKLDRSGGGVERRQTQILSMIWYWKKRYTQSKKPAL